MAAWPALQKFTSKLQAGEHLLRGGLLKQPCLLTHLEIVDNRPFLKLCPRQEYSKTLTMFFTGAKNGAQWSCDAWPMWSQSYATSSKKNGATEMPQQNQKRGALTHSVMEWKILPGCVPFPPRRRPH